LTAYRIYQPLLDHSIELGSCCVSLEKLSRFTEKRYQNAVEIENATSVSQSRDFDEF